MTTHRNIYFDLIIYMILICNFDCLWHMPSAQNKLLKDVKMREITNQMSIFTKKTNENIHALRDNTNFMVLFYVKIFDEFIYFATLKWLNWK